MGYADRALLRRAAREMQDAARRERAMLDMDAPERTYFLGVDAAAQEVLSPELTVARPEGWPAAESPLFREGYARAQSVLSAAFGGSRRPARVPLPRTAVGDIAHGLHHS